MRATAIPVRQTARDLVLAALRQQILSGELPPGERLVAPEIAAQFGVSQTPAREAIQSLQADGLVVISPYKDARVADLDADECEEIYLMREALEKLAAKLGAENVTDEQIAEMQARLDEMAAASKRKDIEGFLQADRAFHEIQFSAAGRPRLWERIIGLRYAGERYTRLSYKNLPHEMESSVPRHAALLESLKERDSDRAAEWVSSTLLRVPFRTRQILHGNLDAAPAAESHHAVHD